MIRVENLVKRFGARVAVDGVTLEVRAGETFGLLGPNGAGKTTTIHMIVGALAPDSGVIRMDGDLVAGSPEGRRRIGIAPQSLSLYPELTGEENLGFFGRLYGLTGTALRERVEWALDFSGLTDRRRDRVKTWSGGMQRRLNLAAALVHDPEFLLLDEPTAGVDPQSRSHLLGRIEELRRAGKSVLYTTHYMEEAQRLCDRIAILDHGKVLALDSIEGILRTHGGPSVVEATLARAPSTGVALPGRLEGLALRFETGRPLEDIGRLAAAGVEFATIGVHRPDLESVFLGLTGRRLRD